MPDPRFPALTLSGRHALVTGGNRGIGLAVAEALSRQGARVTVLVRDAGAGRATADALGGDASFVVADVADAESVRRAAGLASERVPVDLLVNNAGASESAPFLRSDAALWRRMLDVNLMGTVHTTQALIGGMVERGFGRVVNVASTAGLTGYPYVSAYGAAKHAVVGLTRALAREVATKGVTVNAVCPGFTDTDMTTHSVANVVAKTGRDESQALAALVASNPQRRLVQPAEVAAAVAWLCGEAAASVNGQAIAVDGGETA